MKMTTSLALRPRAWMALGPLTCWVALVGVSAVYAAAGATATPAAGHQHHHSQPNATHSTKSIMGGSAVLVPEIATPAPLGATSEHLDTTADGRLILSWVETYETETGGESSQKTSRLRFSLRENGGWSTPRTVVTVHSWLGGRPEVFGLAGGALGAAWIFGGNRDIYLSRSTDDGKTWSEPFQPYSAEAVTAEGQMSVTAVADGRAALTWKDGRRDDGLRIMGTVVDFSGDPGTEIVLDNHLCPCCSADTVAAGGTLSTTYRDLREGNVRDIALVRWSASGVARNGIVHHDHWVLDGCPVNGPAVDRRAGRIMVAWFTAADGAGTVLTAFSPAGERDFGQAIQVDGDAIGNVEALLLKDGSALVAWIGRDGPTALLRVAQVRPDGTVHGRTTVYRGAFPAWPEISLAKLGDAVYLAWVDATAHQIRLVQVPLAEITGPTAPVARVE